MRPASCLVGQSWKLCQRTFDPYSDATLQTRSRRRCAPSPAEQTLMSCCQQQWILFGNLPMVFGPTRLVH